MAVPREVGAGMEDRMRLLRGFSYAFLAGVAFSIYANALGWPLWLQCPFAFLIGWAIGLWQDRIDGFLGIKDPDK